MRELIVGVLALVVVNSAAAQDQSTPTETTLYERAGELYRVRHIGTAMGDACFVEMGDQVSRFTFGVQTDSASATRVSVVADIKPLPPDFLQTGSSVRLKVDVDGVVQSYGLTVAVPTAGGLGLASVIAPPGAWGHLRNAVGHRGGFAVTIGEREPIRFTVPRAASTIFMECWADMNVRALRRLSGQPPPQREKER